ncbi:SGNH/GDSL hydrolase family protein [Pseudomarimonas salicorniae]|uniref:SGNH/GDSL hydrolase family protein n=1 Tax=Pseudomarimonas salicorniae TaxID=2933270 RepID=A0ABT0GIL3_9GAMM|nr:SGNH/GDSL hydrolase family protein [Lysobacter sp. CAU 1642]MCK7594385.1 SGNH/GDSL hydrolase family protein [Lysobacter sp. CAU 1642]
MLGTIGGQAQAREPLRYLALGDSYTIGEAVEEGGRWPVQLVARLGRDGIAVSEPRIIARTGWTTDELSAAMDAAEPLGEWDFVTLLIGVNNQYRGRSIETYREEFRGLLRRAIELARSRPERVMVLAIPDWGVTPFAADRDRAKIAAELDAYNAAAAEISREHGVAFVDTAPISRARGAEAEMVASDGLHPSAALYALWAEAAHPVARDLLSR